MLAEVAKLALDELRARRGHEHLTAVAGGSYARGAVDVVSYIALVGQKRRSGVQADPDLHLPGRERTREGGSGRERSRRGREREEEGVTLRIDLDPALPGAGLADDAAVLGERIGVALGTEGVQELGRALDVGEEESDRAGRKVVAHGARSSARQDVASSRGQLRREDHQLPECAGMSLELVCPELLGFDEGELVLGIPRRDDD